VNINQLVLTGIDHVIIKIIGSHNQSWNLRMTTKANPLSYLNFWETAAEEEFGLLIECATEGDKRLLVNALYECRKQSGGFENLMIFQPNPPNVLFIAKKTTELE